jgi:signal transduction histidine kinase
MYYGVVLIMILYNAVIFVVTRDRTYAYYVVFESAMLVMQTALDRTAFRYLWPGWPTWTQRSEQVLAAACIVAGIALTRAFLALPAHAPRLDRWLSGCGVACAIAGGAATVLTSPAFLMAFGGVLMVAFFVLAGVLLVMARRRTPSARVFAFGWAPVVVGGVMAVASGLGAMPEAVGFVALKVGSAAEAALLALALAGRIVELRRAREQATRELLALQTAQRAALEQRVTERTLELTQALATLRVTQDRLVRRERVATLAGMVAGVAHEVGNPLNFAQGGAAALEDQLDRVVRATAAHGDATEPNPEMTAALADARRALALVHAGHRRIGSIMNNLRGYMQARIIERRPSDLLAELEQALEASGASLARAGVQIERALAPLPPVACREGELGQVFINLIGNACRAMPDGGVLRVSSSVDADIVEIRFADSGPGVPPEHREAIFEPFFSLRGNAAAEVQRDHIGGGLGLFICREIVSQHDGQLLLIEEPGPREVDSPRGAVFAVRLPVSAVS